MKPQSVGGALIKGEGRGSFPLPPASDPLGLEALVVPWPLEGRQQGGLLHNCILGEML
jgi:hypothetical protein